MSENINFKTIMSDKRRLKSAVADFSIRELESALRKFSNVVEQRKLKAEEEESFKQDIRNTAEKTITAIREKHNISRDEAIELLLDIGKEKISKTNRPKKLAPKYRLTKSDGSVYEWAGRGKMPNAFKEEIEKGHRLADFLIEHEK